MPRRVNLPGASELFRGDTTATKKAPRKTAASTSTPATRSRDASSTPDAADPSGPSGRVRHDEKITVYVSSEELLGLERARLDLRAAHGIAVDRGRLVREAIDMVLADLETHGADSELVRRLSQP